MADLPIRLVTGRIYRADGRPWPGAKVSVSLRLLSWDAQNQIPAQAVTTHTDIDGRYSLLLWPNEAGAAATEYEITFPSGETKQFTLPSGPAIEVSPLLDAGLPAASQQGLAVLSFLQDRLAAGAWSSLIAYPRGSVVSLAGAAYVATGDTLPGQQPDAAPWELLVAGGDVGAPGTPGADGRTILNGTGTPANTVGQDNDFFLDTAVTALYGPKAVGAWPASPIALVGPQGAAGQDGATGAAGADGATGPQGLQGDPAPDEQQVDATALPAVAEAGSVNVGAAQPTNRLVAGLRVHRRTIRGYLPNAGKWANKVNGVTSYLLFSATAPAHYLDFGGVADKSGQIYDFRFLLKSIQRTSHSWVPLFAIEGSDKTYYLFASPFTDARLNGRAFSAWVEFTDAALGA